MGEQNANALRRAIRAVYALLASVFSARICRKFFTVWPEALQQVFKRANVGFFGQSKRRRAFAVPLARVARFTVAPDVVFGCQKVLLCVVASIDWAERHHVSFPPLCVE